jgi:hypothetical protein
MPLLFLILGLRCFFLAKGLILAKSWSAVFSMPDYHNASGLFFYGQQGQQSRIKLTVSKFGRQPQQNIDILSFGSGVSTRDITMGEGTDSAVCVRLGQAPGADLFDGLLSNGKRRIAAAPNADRSLCEMWDFTSSNGSIRSSVCLGDDGLPMQLNTTANVIFGIPTGTVPKVSSESPWSCEGGEGCGWTSIRFTHAKTELPSDAFASSGVCSSSSQPTPCAHDRTIMLHLYRVHGPEEPTVLVNRDAGDALGELGWLCSDNASAFKSKLVTYFEVLANSSWGQYSPCMFDGQKNVCVLEGAGGTVGRQGAWAQGGVHGGQCSPNGEVGSWYSFPAEGECKPGASIGSDGCTWGNSGSVRTVSAKCILEDRGLASACSSPSQAEAVLRSALSSSDLSQGGCPDVLV